MRSHCILNTIQKPQTFQSPESRGFLSSSSVNWALIQLFKCIFTTLWVCKTKPGQILIFIQIKKELRISLNLLFLHVYVVWLMSSFVNGITSRCVTAELARLTSLSGSALNSFKIITFKGLNTSFLLTDLFSLHLFALVFILLVLLCVFCFSSPYVFLWFGLWQQQPRSQPEKWTWLDSFWLWEKTNLMWLWWMCGAKICSFPVEVTAEGVFNEFS